MLAENAEYTSEISIEAGKKVFLTPTGNAKRGWDGVEPFEGIVTSIKRKYFYVRRCDMSFCEVKFEKETLVSQCEDCNSGYLLWATT